MKTILHVIDSLARGGAERVVVNNIKLFTEYKHVLCLLHGPFNFIEELGDDIPVEVINFKSKLGVLTAVYRLRKIIKKYQPDIVHTHLLWSSWLVRLAKPSGLPLVSSIHSILSKGAFNKNWHSRIIEQFTSKKTNTIITVSNAVKNDYLNHIQYKGAVETIYNFSTLKGMKRNVIRYEPGTVLKIMVVGNIIPVKNHNFLIDALSNLSEQYLKKLKIDVYGYGELNNNYKTKVKNEKLPITFSAATSAELSLRYSEYDAFCMPSLYEGMPMALLEAIEAGLPLILSEIDVFRELANEHALFFSIKNTDQLCRIIVDVIDGNIDLAKFKEKAEDLRNTFDDRERYIREHYQVYCALLK